MEDYNKANVRLNQLDPSVFDSVYTFKSNVGDTYEITFNDDGSIQNIESNNKHNYPFDLDSINNYWVDRGFELSHAIAATFKEKGPGGEDALGLGYYNESNTINETFKKHLSLLKNKLNEGWNDDEDKMLDYLQRLADNDSDDLYDAMRDFKATYGYTPSIRRRSSYSSRPSLTGKTLYFYNVPPDKQNDAYRLLKKTKTGKWYSLVPNPEADKLFGKGRPWTAK